MLILFGLLLGSGPTPAATAPAAPPATATATAEIRAVYDPHWGSQKAPLTLTIGTDTRTLAAGETAAAVVVKAEPHGSVVPVTSAIGRETRVTRQLVVLPGFAYTIKGNPCAHWEVLQEPRVRGSSQIRFDSTAVSRGRHPLKVQMTFDGDALTLAAPATSAAIEPALSAMCPRSGVTYKVVDAKKRVLFDQNLILPEGRISTLSLTTNGKWSVSVGEEIPPEDDTE